MIGPDLHACKQYKSLLAPLPSAGAVANPPETCGNALALCKTCRRAGRTLCVHLCADRFEAAHPSLPPADLVMLFHPGLAATNTQVIEGADAWVSAQPGVPRSVPSGAAVAGKRTQGSGGCGAGVKRQRGDGSGSRADGGSGGQRKVMPSLAKAWAPCLSILRAARAPIFVTAFSRAGMQPPRRAC